MKHIFTFLTTLLFTQFSFVHASNDNPKFSKPAQRQELFNAVVIDSKWDADPGSADDPVLCQKSSLYRRPGRAKRDPDTGRCERKPDQRRTMAGRI